jgi:SEC-C motif
MPTNEDEGTPMVLDEAASTINMSAASTETMSDMEMTEKPSPSEPVKKNSPCPCGSGLRFKKCCAAQEKRASRLTKMRQGAGSNVSNTSSRSDEPTMNGNFRVLHI